MSSSEVDPCQISTSIAIQNGLQTAMNTETETNLTHNIATSAAQNYINAEMESKCAHDATTLVVQDDEYASKIDEVCTKCGNVVDAQNILVDVGGKTVSLSKHLALNIPPVTLAITHSQCNNTLPLSLPISYSQLVWLMHVLYNSKDGSPWMYESQLILLERLRCIDSCFDHSTTLYYAKSLLDNVPAKLWGCPGTCIKKEDIDAAKNYRQSVYLALGGRKGSGVVAEIYPDDVMVMEDRYMQGEKGVNTSWMLSYKTNTVLDLAVPVLFTPITPPLTRQSTASSIDITPPTSPRADNVNSSPSTPRMLSPPATPRSGSLLLRIDSNPTIDLTLSSPTTPRKSVSPMSSPSTTRTTRSWSSTSTTSSYSNYSSTSTKR